MNRRNFLHKSTMAAVIAAGLPEAVRTRQQNYPAVYKSEAETAGLAGQSYYEIGIFHSAIQNFSAAPEQEKIVGLKVNLYEITERTAPSKTGEYKYIIQGTELINKENNIWKITTKLDKKIAGDHKFSKEYPKNLEFQCKPLAYINILDKKDVPIVSIPYKPPTTSTPSSGDACFLTTACVNHKGKPDHCEELQLLRQLRDGYMKHSAEGQVLVSQYSVVGPEIVQAINGCNNKGEIYEYMYREMILPSVELVKKGKLKEAQEQYTLFVIALKERYC